jgi:hypothetical protein
MQIAKGPQNRLLYTCPCCFRQFQGTTETDSKGYLARHWGAASCEELLKSPEGTKETIHFSIDFWKQVTATYKKSEREEENWM